MFAPRPEVESLLKILLTIDVGDSISYAALSAAIGLDVRTTAKSSLWTARKRLIIEHGRKFECVNLSLQRLDDIGVIRIGGKDLQFIRRKGKRTFRDMTQCVQNYEALPNGEKQNFDTRISVAAVLGEGLRPKVLDKIGPLIQHESASRKVITETMDALRKMIA